MKRPSPLTLVVLVFAILGQPQPASAWGFWAWLEEWSGPGPFRGGMFLFTTCRQDTHWKLSPIAMQDEFHQDKAAVARQIVPFYKDETTESEILRRLLAYPTFTKTASSILAAPPPAPPPPAPTGSEPALGPMNFAFVKDLYIDQDVNVLPRHAHERLLCYYADYGFFSAEADAQRGFPKVGVTVTDIGPIVRLNDGLDIGGGFGWANFNSRPEGGDTVKKTRFALTPIRVVLRPVLLAMPEHWRKRHAWLGVFTVYWKETLVYGTLTGADFGNPENPFATRDELIRSFGFNFDVGSLLTLF